jgi:hypothetical protein
LGVCKNIGVAGHTTTADAYPATASFAGIAVEQRRNPLFTHAIEVVWNPDLTAQEAKPPDPPRLGCLQMDDLHQWLACLRDDKGLTASRLLDQSREVRLGLVDIDTLRRAAFLN